MLNHLLQPGHKLRFLRNGADPNISKNITQSPSGGRHIPEESCCNIGGERERGGGEAN